MRPEGKPISQAVFEAQARVADQLGMQKPENPMSFQALWEKPEAYQESPIKGMFEAFKQKKAEVTAGFEA